MVANAFAHPGLCPFFFFQKSSFHFDSVIGAAVSLTSSRRLWEMLPSLGMRNNYEQRRRECLSTSFERLSSRTFYDVSGNFSLISPTRRRRNGVASPLSGEPHRACRNAAIRSQMIGASRESVAVSPSSVAASGDARTETKAAVNARRLAVQRVRVRQRAGATEDAGDGS